MVRAALVRMAFTHGVFRDRAERDVETLPDNPATLVGQQHTAVDPELQIDFLDSTWVGAGRWPVLAGYKLAGCARSVMIPLRSVRSRL